MVGEMRKIWIKVSVFLFFSLRVRQRIWVKFMDTPPPIFCMGFSKEGSVSYCYTVFLSRLSLSRFPGWLLISSFRGVGPRACSTFGGSRAIRIL